jgi:regulator of protease activity HflC (stomatin/prohibitin superfamily)
MRQNDCSSVSEQVLAEQKKRAKRERAAEKRRKKTRDKHRAQGLEHTRKYLRGR